MTKPSFEWDERKDAENTAKHGVPFALAQYAFADPKRVIAEDRTHSGKEPRYFRKGVSLLLLRTDRRRHYDRTIHLSVWCDPYIRCRLLAQGKDNL